MPALDFPSSPTNGQVYGQYTYDSTKGAWRVSSNSLTSVISSPTAPSSPVAGNVWYNTNDGSMYVYYNDGDTSQWVEMRSEIANSQVGLIPIIPTSISVSSGSGSVAADGLITFSGTGEIRINGVFSSAYKNYRIIHTSSGSSANTGVSYRLRAAGTDYSTANQKYGVSYWGLPGAVSNTGGSSETVQQIGWVEGTSGNRNVASVDIYNPFETVHTGYTSVFGSYVGGVAFGYVPTTSSYDGITFSVTGTYSGTVKVYGYR
jgi:hypothetical protein